MVWIKVRVQRNEKTTYRHLEKLPTTVVVFLLLSNMARSVFPCSFHLALLLLVPFPSTSIFFSWQWRHRPKTKGSCLCNEKQRSSPWHQAKLAVKRMKLGHRRALSRSHGCRVQGGAKRAAVLPLDWRPHYFFLFGKEQFDILGHEGSASVSRGPEEESSYLRCVFTSKQKSPSINNRIVLLYILLCGHLLHMGRLNPHNALHIWVLIDQKSCCQLIIQKTKWSWNSDQCTGSHFRNKK